MVGVLEEHLEYLSLKGRHSLFAKAIGRVIRPGDIVADLGCGFGVLGFQCLEAGAGHVYGIDRSDALEIARETARREGLSGRYQCIRGSSFAAELPEPVDLIVCDHVGFFGIDYGIIAMLQDARTRMLKAGGAVMPRRIDLKVAGVSSDRRRALATAWSQEPVPGEYAWLDSYAANSRHRVELEADELCSAPVTLGSVPLDKDCPDTLAFATEIAIDRQEELHGIAGWFDCELAKDIWMTNSPVEDRSIGRSQAYFPLAAPFRVEAGDHIAISFRIVHEGPVLTWTITPPGNGPAQTMTTWKSTILSPADLAGPSSAPLAPNALARARKALLDLLDGTRTADEIEAAMLAVDPPLFPSAPALQRFVRAELKAIAQ